MRWRPIRRADLSRCLDVQPACFGDRIVGHQTALRVWHDLLEHPGFHGAVIESERPIAGRTIVGCGMGAFVSPGFVDREIANPRPGLNARIIAAVAAGEPILLTRDAVGAGNAGGGVDFVNLYGTWRDGILDPDRLVEVQTLLGIGFVEQLGGYRFSRVIKEPIGEARIALARATGAYRMIAAFPECESALVAVTRESALSSPYSAAAALYRYREPVLRLRPAEQALLTAALDGETDAELSARLGLSLQATKKRWLSVFARVSQFKPDVLSESQSDGESRGPQKRHRVVAYVRSHPEELRPYSWRPTSRR
jgi:hypothetical protein